MFSFIITFQYSSLDGVPYNIRLQSLEDRSSRPSSGVYEQIPPRLPPARETNINTKEEDMEECATFQNRNVRSGSNNSTRYVPAPNPGGPLQEDADYAEIDGTRGRGSKLKDRRPSEYEKVFVRELGFVSTENSHPLSPTRSATNSQNEGDTEGAMKLALSNAVAPPLNPMVGNDYEFFGNPGFHMHSNENSPPENSGAPPSSPPITQNDIEVIKNESYSEIPVLQSRTHSVSQTASNPMYSTIPTDKKTKKPVQSSQYEVIPNHPSSGKSLGDALPVTDQSRARDFHHGTNEEGANKSVSKSGYGTYDVPPSHHRENTSTLGVNGLASSLPGHATYDVPPNSKDRPMVNPGYAMYDVPPDSDSEDKHSTPNSNHATYDVPTNSQTKKSANGFNEVVVNPSSATYDVPPNNSLARPSTREVNDSTPLPHSYHVWYEIPPSDPDGNKSAYYKYDVPPSNLPAPNIT